MKILQAGILGCGKIAATYAENLLNRYSDRLQPVLCADIDTDRAEAFAQEYGLRAVSVEQLLASREISVVLNLTIPSAHFALSLAALQSGKHVYSEKPLALTVEEADELIAEA